MAFDANVSPLNTFAQTGGGEGIRFFSYRTDDTSATVQGPGYFAGCGSYGVRPGDLIFVTPLNASAEGYIVTVSGIDASGNVTVTAASGSTARFTFDMYGALGQASGADDTDALNAAFAALRAAINSNTLGMTEFELDGEGRIYRCSGTVNAGLLVSGRNVKVHNFGIYSTAVGKVAFDTAGTGIIYWDNITIEGAATDPPDVGWWGARAVGLPGSAAQVIGRLECFGTFKRAAFVNYSCEVMSIACLKTSNRYWDSSACCSVFAGHSEVIANSCGLPDSTANPYLTGTRSMSVVEIGMHNAQRGPAYTYPLSNITKANPAVATMSPANMATAIANYGFANGRRVHLEDIDGDGIGLGNWANTANGRVPTIGSLNAVTGTFELIGLDTSAVHDNYLAGVVHNNTGVSVVLGNVVCFKEGQVYHTSYSDSKYLLDVTNDFDRNWNIFLEGSYEPAGPSIINIKGGTIQSYVRNLWIKNHNSGSVTAPIMITGVSGGGSVVLSGGGIVLGNRGQLSTAGMISGSEHCEMRGFEIQAPDELSFVGQAPFFNDPVFDLVIPNRIPFKQYFGQRKWSYTNTITDLATFECTSDEDHSGPQITLRRENNSIAAGDLLGFIKFSGSNSVGTDFSYSGIRTQVVTPVDGAETGRLEFLVAKDGLSVTREAFIDKYGLQGIYKSQTITTDGNPVLSVQSDYVQIFHAVTLTMDRTVTLSSTGAIGGAMFRITRTGAGAFNLNVVGPGALKSLATNTWADFVYDEAAVDWKLSAFGTL